MHAGTLRAELDTDVGAALTDLSIQGPLGDQVPLLRRAPARLAGPQHAASFVLAPWSNRIDEARFVFDGVERTLSRNFPDGTAIHGDVWTRAWRLTDRTPVSARLALDSDDHRDVNWPWRFGCVQRVELAPDHLELELSVTNLADTPMPAGCGHHPYFCRRLWSDDDVVEVQAPVSGRYPARRQIPTGPPADDAHARRLRDGGPLGNPGLDDVFAGFAGRAEVRWPASGVTLRMDASPGLGHLVVFTPRTAAHPEAAPLSWFCLEPVSMVNDGFNALARGDDRTGVVVLEPGQTLNTSVRMTVTTT